MLIKSALLSLIAIVLVGCSGRLPAATPSSDLVRKDSASDTVTKAQFRKVRSDLRDLRRQVAASSKRKRSHSDQSGQISEKIDSLMKDVERLKTQSSHDMPRASSEELNQLIARIEKLEEVAGRELVEAEPSGVGVKMIEKKSTSSSSVEISELRARLEALQKSNQEMSAKYEAFEEDIHKEIVFLTDKLITIYAAIRKLEKEQAQGPLAR